jgi:hypothetical protein
MELARLNAFSAAYMGRQIDAVAIYIHDSATNIAYFQNYISIRSHTLDL